jgi:hypothetical protein
MSDPKQQPVQYYDLKAAREHGISDSDILNQLAQTHNYDLTGAREHGISDADILNTLVGTKPPAEQVVEKESPEIIGGIGGTAGAVGAVGDVIYSKGRPLIRMAEKAFGLEPSASAVKPRTFLDPSTVAQQAINRRTVAEVPEGSTTTVRNWTTGKPGEGTGQHAGEFLGGANYKEANKIAEEALAAERQFPGQKVLPGSLISVPEHEARNLAQQRAALAAQDDIAKQAEVRAVAQTRAERLGERSALKAKENKYTVGKETTGLLGKAALPIFGGYEAGAQGAQAYNRLTRPDMTAGDVASGLTNVVGSAAGATSAVPFFKGKTRIPAAIIAQGAGAVANFLDKRNPRNEGVEQKAAGGLAGLADGGKPPLPGKLGKAVSLAQKAAHELHGQTPGRMTDWLQHNIGKFVVPTQSDRMGGVGGPSFSANSIALPQYKGKAWGSGNEGTATSITNLAKDERFGGPENQIFVPLLGHQNQHKSNQIAFDRLMKDFYEHPEKLTPELRAKINDFMQSGGGIEKATGQPFFSPFADFDIADKDMVGLLGRSFDNRGLIAQHAFGGERLGKTKSQIFPYQQRLDEMADPTVAGAPTFAVGPRAFQLTGNVHPEARPDLNAAFPYLLEGRDLNVAYKPVENSAIFQDFQNQWRQHKGKTEPLKSGKLPEPGYYENTIGYKVNPDDAERIYPRQEVTEQLLDSMYKKGHAAGGSIDGYADGKSVMPDVSVSARSMPSMTGMPGVGYMQTPQGAMARLQMEKELEEARIRAGVSGMAMSIPGQQGVKTMPGQMDIGANIPVGRGNLDISANRSINPIPGRGHMQGVNARYTMPFAQGGEVQHFAAGKKVLSSGLDALREMIKAQDRTPIVPVPNRWFSQPDKFPHVQGMVNKTLDSSQLPREAFHSGAFIDPRTGKVLDRNIYNDVGVLIDPETGRPMMSAGKESGIDILDPKTGSYTKSNLVRQSLFKPTGGDPMLADMPFIATIEKGDMGHKYALGTEYATPTEMYNTMTGANPTLRPRSRGDVFGMGDVIGQVQIGGRGIPHDVYEKLFVAPKGSDVPGVKLNKAEGGLAHLAGGGTPLRYVSNWLLKGADELGNLPLKRPVYLSDEAKLQGFTSPEQNVFYGVTKTGQEFTIPCEYVDPNTVAYSNDKNKTADFVRDMFRNYKKPE